MSVSPNSEKLSVPWYREMNAYHWIVFVVCSLGWAFDCLDQHLFTYVRAAALGELIKVDSASDRAILYATIATSIMMIGWATGGIIFGIIGDKFGRARTMVYTILIYSVLTGLSAFSVTIYDFMIIRFLAGIGIGGQFAVGASLLAESMPSKARPYVLGIMQVLSAVGNIGAALVAMFFTEMEAMQLLPMSGWRCIFLFGSIPAILAYFIVRYLHEPESWKKSVEHGRKNVGSVRELFTEPTLRKHVILGMILAATGVIGAWGIGLFSLELSRKVVENVATQSVEYKQARQSILDKYNIKENTDAITPEIQSEINTVTKASTKTVADRWAARNLLIYNVGAMAGMYGFTLGAVYWGRRMTFTVFMIGCILFTSATFLFMNSPLTQLLLVPPMGFFLMSMFGGYTIYFPELFPTRLRSTGVSFCYNVGRYIAACGPLALGGLTALFSGFATPEDSTIPFRYAGVTMCSVFIFGIIVIWFLPETKGKPLPE
ncbi:MAG: MFS transporter [Planctomycetaceae bacterium]|jgi:MFS family permease|nr:MFS transporter [Planctomycetaceae bacterium]